MILQIDVHVDLSKSIDPANVIRDITEAIEYNATRVKGVDSLTIAQVVPEDTGPIEVSTDPIVTPEDQPDV